MKLDLLIPRAVERLKPYIRRTPADFSDALSGELGFPGFFKKENHQISGSFKARGAFNKVLSELEKQGKPGFFVTASTGNHAAGFALALRMFNLEGKIFLPESVLDSKLEFIRSQGIPWERVGRDCLETELFTREIAEKQNWTMVPPYNDSEIIAGQGTIACELIEQVPELEVVLVPVGGGGLISGIAYFLKRLRPHIEIIGCQPVNSPEMYLSLKAGKIISENVTKPTLSDATAGGIEPGSVTFALCRQYVDDIILLEESEIASAIHWMLRYHMEIIEGAAALTIAAARKIASRIHGKKTVLILSGRQLSYNSLKRIING